MVVLVGMAAASDPVHLPQSGVLGPAEPAAGQKGDLKRLFALLDIARNTR